MILTPRSTFGPYYVTALIGAGGMGEVYQATDPKLGRSVALKVLRAAFSSAAEHRESFEREARLLASLNHPNIATVYGFFEIDGVSALALEFVEGETLASRLREQRLPEAEALRYAVQITDALAYAHRRGVVHRDVKPSNIVITSAGAKLLDFGLAYLVQSATMAETAPGAGTDTEPGPAGTPFYMSPEQSAGIGVDQRSDIYSFGLVLCQMLIGFTPDAISGLSTRTLIRGLLNQIGNRPLRLIIERCLASDPDERWLHASDLHHALVAVSEPDIGNARSEDDGTGTASVPLVLRRPERLARVWIQRAAVALVVSITAAAAYVVGSRTADISPPEYQQLTFRTGSVTSARFAGNTIVYSAAWNGRPAELWSMRPESPESRRLGITDASLASVSRQGEMAILIGRRPFIQSTNPGGMLARLPLDASAPRDVLSDVEDADWSPDGQSLAVAHVIQGKSRLEFPIGTVLYESPGWIDGVRVSPDAAQIALIDHPVYYDDRGGVSVVSREGGSPRVLSSGWSSVTGLIWSPAGDEVWFTAAKYGATTSLYAVNLSGRLRVLWHSAGRMTVRDVDRGGRVLLTEGKYRLRISAMDSGSSNERDLSWLDGSVLADLSSDGTTMLINEQAAGGGTPLYAVYLRKTDGSPAVRIGEGSSPVLSPDGRWAATLLLSSRPSIALVPTGAGQGKMLDLGAIAHLDAVAWFPDGRRLLIAGSEVNRQSRLWTQELADASLRPVSAEGFRIPDYSRPISPDGTRATVIDAHGRIWIHPLNGAGTPQAVTALQPDDLPICWDKEGKSFYVYRHGELPAVIYRLYPADGRKERVATLAPADVAGVRRLSSLQTTPDARLFVYSYAQNLSDLYLVTNVR
jgi:eukaryotic-like serine/threonine-protein kinase